MAQNSKSLIFEAIKKIDLEKVRITRFNETMVESSFKLNCIYFLNQIQITGTRPDLS